MSEIIRGKTGQGVTFDTDATSVTARIGRELDSLSSTTVSIVDGGVGPYYRSALVPYSISRADGVFYVEWTFTIDGNQYTRIDQHEVVTPFVIYEESELSQEDYEELEPIVRRFINAYTNNYFGYYEGFEIVRGQGLDYLHLPNRLDNLVSIEFNGAAYEPEAFVVIGDRYLKRRPGIVLDIKDAPPEELLPPNSTGVIVSPYANKNMVFWDDRDYAINGGWGYRSVPENIIRAAKLLLKDWSCADAAYRNKYLENMRASDWRIQFKDAAFAGTGNLTADKLLGDYIIPEFGLV